MKLEELWELYCVSEHVKDYRGWVREVPGSIDYTPDSGLMNLIQNQGEFKELRLLSSEELGRFDYEPGEIPPEFDFDFMESKRIVIRLKRQRIPSDESRSKKSKND